VSISGLHGHHHGPGDRRLVRSPSAVAVAVVERAGLRQRPSFRHAVVLLRKRLGGARVPQARHAAFHAERSSLISSTSPVQRLDSAYSFYARNATKCRRRPGGRRRGKTAGCPPRRASSAPHFPKPLLGVTMAGSTAVSAEAIAKDTLRQLL